MKCTGFWTVCTFYNFSNAWKVVKFNEVDSQQRNENHVSYERA